MDNEERLWLVRCPFCGKAIALATILDMYDQSFWCSNCSLGVYVDPLRPQRVIPRRKNTRYNDI